MVVKKIPSLKGPTLKSKKHLQVGKKVGSEGHFLSCLLAYVKLTYLKVSFLKCHRLQADWTDLIGLAHARKTRTVLCTLTSKQDKIIF